MMIKTYTANVYKNGSIVGSVVGCFWILARPLKCHKKIKSASVQYYGDDTVIADFRRV